MTSSPNTLGLGVQRLSGSLGAEIRGISLEKAGAAEADKIRSLLTEHLVLFFPDQHLTIDEHVAFGRFFGDLEGHPNLASPFSEHPEIFDLGYFQAAGDWQPLHQPAQTFAVNYQQNFDLVERVFAACYPQDDNFSLQSVMALLQAHPELTSLMGPPTA